MEITMHLAQPVCAVFQTPSPVDARVLDRLERLGGEAIDLRRVGIDNAHDAFMMADKLAQATRIERGIRSADLVNADEVVAECIGASEIAVQQVGTVAEAREILIVSVARHEFVQDEELLDGAER